MLRNFKVCEYPISNKECPISIGILFRKILTSIFVIRLFDCSKVAAFGRLIHNCRIDTMKIILNGKEKKLKAVNLEKILASLRFNPEKLIVSVNGDLVEKADYAKTTLSEGDNLEVFSFVGGG